MDVDDVRICLRALLSSTKFAYTLKPLLNDFKNMTGFDLPLFGCLHPVEFLRTLDDTVQLFGDPCNPQVALVESKKSAHITSLVDRQKNNTLCSKYPSFLSKQKRLIIPDICKKEDIYSVSEVPLHKNFKENMTSQENIFRFGSSPPQKSEEPAFKTAVNLPTFDNSSLRHQNYKETVSLKDDVTMTNKSENLFNKKNSPSIPGQELTDTKKTKITKPVDDPQENIDSCYFDDIETEKINENDSESSSDAVINEGIKNKFRKLLKNYPEGLWCCELPQLYLKEFNYVLDYREFGYTSLIQMLSELSDVFRCVRPGNGDWILFDASVSPSPKEEKMRDLELAMAISCDIKRNLRKLLLTCFENESEVELSKIMDLYEKMFGSSLDFQSLGFKDLKSLMETWEDDVLNIVNRDGKTFIVQGLKQTIHSPIPWEEAIPPITAENDIFVEIFPKDVVGPDECLSELDLMRHVAVGNTVEVSIAEVWSPQKFYLQLNKFKKRLNGFMDDLQNFYNVYLHKYKMPDSTIRPNQVCVGLYNSDPDIPEEWHRAQIVKVINEKIVLINFVDYGTLARVKKSQLRFLHRSFQSFPIQAFLAQLSGIVPLNNETKWPVSTSKRFLELTRVVYLKAEITNIDFKVPCMSVTLFDPFEKSGVSINKKLVLEKLALVKEPDYEDPFPEEVKDTALQDLKTPERQKKELNGISPDVTKQDNLTKNLPELRDEFSDIADLGQTTFFQFKMKSLKLEDSLTSEKKKESKTEPINATVNFEFEEVPDLEKNEKKNLEKTSEEKKMSEEIISNDVFKNEKNPPALKGNFLIQPKPVLEQTPSSLPGKPSRLPPGLEHVEILPNFNQTQFYLQPRDYRKAVNILAMELLATKSSIKQVGLSNPALAIEIATEMAEAYMYSQYPGGVPYNRAPLPGYPFSDVLVPPVEVQPKVFEETAVPVVPVFPVSLLAPKSTEATSPLNDKKDFMSN